MQKYCLDILDSFNSSLARTPSFPPRVAVTDVCSGANWRQFMRQDSTPYQIFNSLGQQAFGAKASWDALLRDGANDSGGLTSSRALACLDDSIRTKVCCQAIRDKIDSLPSSATALFVDAGCGPGSPMSIYAAWYAFAYRSDLEFKVIGFEINPVSVKISQDLIQNIGLDNKINIYLADATQDSVLDFIPTNVEDIIVFSETMMAGFTGKNEPMLEILHNFSALALENQSQRFHFIPESAALSLGWIPDKQPENHLVYDFWDTHHNIPLDYILIPGVEVLQWNAGQLLEKVEFEVVIPANLPETVITPIIQTEVRFGAKAILKSRASVITEDLRIIDSRGSTMKFDNSSNNMAGKKLVVAYRVNSSSIAMGDIK